MTGTFAFNSFMLGVGLAMDAFSVSLANGLSDPHMKKNTVFLIAGTFGLFQAMMPMIGWVSVRRMVRCFQFLTPFIPWISLGLLSLIGGNMIYEGMQGKESIPGSLEFAVLLMQGVATSIDALSVGFAISPYDFQRAALCSGIIAGVTFLICLAGVMLGKRLAAGLSGKAMILGGTVLILVGIEIFLKSILK